MSEEQKTPPRERSASAQATDSLAAFWALMKEERVVILRITAAVTVLATLYAFVMPHTYSSTVTILPPQRQERGTGLADVLAAGGATDMFDVGTTLGFGARPSDIFVKILASRTVSDSLIRAFRLDAFFGIPPGKPWRLAARPLRDATTIEGTKDGMITVTVSLKTSALPSEREIDSIKRMAADLANAYVRYLDAVNREKMVSAATNSRKFIQEQLDRTAADLDSAYTDLVAYQESRRALMVDKQLDALVTTAGALKLRLAEASAELGVARRDMLPSSRTVRELESKVAELQKQYDRLTVEGGGDKDFLLAFAKFPKVARDLSFLMRRVKLLEEVNAYLTKQFYKERVQEARDLPTVQVLDPAVPAWERTAPRRMQWMLVSFVVGLIGSVVFVVGKHTARRRREQGRNAGGSDAPGRQA